MTGSFPDYLANTRRIELGDQKEDVVWFAFNDNRPLFTFAGIWTTFQP
jgi:putative SOS response-associated peptidase YedK